MKKCLGLALEHYCFGGGYFGNHSSQAASALQKLTSSSALWHCGHGMPEGRQYSKAKLRTGCATVRQHQSEKYHSSTPSADLMSRQLTTLFKPISSWFRRHNRTESERALCSAQLVTTAQLRCYSKRESYKIRPSRLEIKGFYYI